MAALPQAIQSAKELYDLRSRYKDASVLITAIYSESMVIAASLSQVQNLLLHDALQSKPQLLETFDCALTGCRVVYGCLEEEVRDLVVKAEADKLKFKDRAKFLWKEDTFKELLTQIRGQQSALSLLIQGLQMESIADIRKLVEENSATLDQVVKRSRTLRQSHPRVRVPESLFSHTQQEEDAVDAESIVKSTEFTFDDEVINSKAYRRAMRLYTSTNEPQPSGTPDTDVERDHPPAYAPSSQDIHDHDVKESSAHESSDQEPSTHEHSDQEASTHEHSDKEPSTHKHTNEELSAHEQSDKESSLLADAATPALSVDTESGAAETNLEMHALEESPVTEDHHDTFESIEKDYLPYMPRSTSTAPHSSLPRANTSALTVQTDANLHVPVRSYSEGSLLLISELPPPLPPRRPSSSQLLADAPTPETSKIRSASSDDSTITTATPSVWSSASATSSRTTHEPLRKLLPPTHRISNDVLGTVHNQSSMSDSPRTTSPLYNHEMHEIWLLIINAERAFIDRMSKFRKMFYDNVVRQWPLVEKHLEPIIVGERLAALNRDLLLRVMEQQVSEADSAICDSTVFEQWTNQAHKIYREYCQGLPHTASSLRTTQTIDPKFAPFVNTVGLSVAWFGMGWEDYLKLPMVQLEFYVNKLQSLIRLAEGLDEPAAFHEVTRLKDAVAAIQWLIATTSTVLRNAERREEVKNLERRIHTLDSNILSQLRLLDSGRRVRYQGSMAIKLKSQGPWQAVHVMLLDNFLLWGKLKPQKKSKGDKIIVLDSPIAVDDLDVSTPCEDHIFQKATLFDDIPRGSVMYIITVKSKSNEVAEHMLGAFGLEPRKAWLEHFTTATKMLQART